MLIHTGISDNMFIVYPVYSIDPLPTNSISTGGQIEAHTHSQESSTIGFLLKMAYLCRRFLIIARQGKVDIVFHLGGACASQLSCRCVRRSLPLITVSLRRKVEEEYSGNKMGRLHDTLCLQEISAGTPGTFAELIYQSVGVHNFFGFEQHLPGLAHSGTCQQGSAQDVTPTLHSTGYWKSGYMNMPLESSSEIG